MGASGWEYIVPYQHDLAAALADLRRYVFERGDYISPANFGLPAPPDLEALTDEEYWEFIESGCL